MNSNLAILQTLTLKVTMAMLRIICFPMVADETQPVGLGTSFLHIMYSFLSLTINMPLVYKGDLKDYWSTNPLIRIEIFSKVMSRDRYLVLLRMLDFANNAENPGDDRLFRIRYVFEDLVRKFKSYFQPF